MKKYTVTVSKEERPQWHAVVKKGQAAARTRLQAQILRHAGTTAEQWTEEAMSTALDVQPTPVATVRQRCGEEGVEAALRRRRVRRQPRRKLDGKQEAHLIALACSDPPGGQARWSLRLLADRLVEVQIGDPIPDETVRQALKKPPSSRG